MTVSPLILTVKAPSVSLLTLTVTLSPTLTPVIGLIVISASFLSATKPTDSLPALKSVFSAETTVILCKPLTGGVNDTLPPTTSYCVPSIVTTKAAVVSAVTLIVIVSLTLTSPGTAMLMLASTLSATTSVFCSETFMS